MPLPDEVKALLPEEMQGNEILNRYDSLEALGAAVIEQRSLISQSIRIPGEDAGEEARTEFVNKLVSHVPELTFKPDLASEEQSAEFFRTMGKPDDKANYENPEDTELPAEVEGELRDIAFKANMTNGQYQQMVSDLAGMENQRAEAMTAAQTEDAEKLKGKWGQAFEERETAAKKVNDEFFPGRDFDKLSGAEKEGLYNMSKSLTGKPAQAANQPSQETGKFTPDEAQRRANEIMRSKEWFDNTDPQRQQELQKKVLDLLEQAGGVRSLDGLRAEGRASF